MDQIHVHEAFQLDAACHHVLDRLREELAGVVPERNERDQVLHAVQLLALKAAVQQLLDLLAVRRRRGVQVLHVGQHARRPVLAHGSAAASAAQGVEGAGSACPPAERLPSRRAPADGWG